MKLMTSALLVVLTSSVMAAPRPSRFYADDAASAGAEPFPVTAASSPTGLHIINDDFARARAEANQRKLPLFVEVWAPW